MVPLANNLIGEFSLDLANIYYEEGHEIYKRWVGLTCSHTNRKPLIGSAAEGGIQGYVRLSLTLLGPGDKAPVHLPGEKEPVEVALLPPTVKLKLGFLVVQVHRAEQLPKMDRTWMGKEPKGAGIDAYVKVRLPIPRPTSAEPGTHTPATPCPRIAGRPSFTTL